MKPRDLSVIACAGAVLVAALSTPAVGATRQALEVTASKAAWHAQAPPCTAIDCSVLPLLSPYPEDTLHVSVSAGQETARTYLAFPIVLPTTGRLIGGSLQLPLDVDPANGSAAPETAEFGACLSTTRFEPVRGSFAEPPKTVCRVRKPAVYDEKSVAFTVGLGPFVEHWKKDQAALALVPSKAAIEGGQTWHVVFPAGDDEASDAAQEEPQPQIVATLEYETDATSSGPGPPIDVGTDTPPDPSGATGSGTLSSGSSTGPSFDDGTGFTSGQPSTDAPEVAQPTELSAGESAPAASFIEGFAGPGFAYPIVWAFPLLVLLLLGSVGRALTKDLYRRGM